MIINKTGFFLYNIFKQLIKQTNNFVIRFADMEQNNNEIATSLKNINDNIQAALKESQLNQSVRLVAVSKFKPPDHIQEVYDCGIKDFGENYVDELVEKSAQVFILDGL